MLYKIQTNENGSLDSLLLRAWSSDLAIVADYREIVDSVLSSATMDGKM